MATKGAGGGLDHPTTVPANFDPESGERDDVDSADGPDAASTDQRSA